MDYLDDLHSNPKPSVVRYLEELEGFLNEWPDDESKRDWRSRLRSKFDIQNWSAILELSLGHILKDRFDQVEHHPVVLGTTTTPDFLVHTDPSSFYVEAVVATDDQAQQQFTSWLDGIVRRLETVTGPVSVWVQPRTGPPESRSHLLALEKRIERFLRQQLQVHCPRNLVDRTITFSETVGNQPVIVDFLVLGENEGEQSVLGMYGRLGAVEIKTHERIRLAVATKCSKYGCLDVPYVVAVWPVTQFPVNNTRVLRALYGDWSIQLSRSGPVSQGRLPNGAFTKRKGERIHGRKVSAVAIYQEKWTEGGCQRQLYIYHNPNAVAPLPPSCFAGLPQLLCKDVGQGYHCEWTDCEPEWYA